MRKIIQVPANTVALLSIRELLIRIIRILYNHPIRSADQKTVEMLAIDLPVPVERAIVAIVIAITVEQFEFIP